MCTRRTLTRRDFIREVFIGIPVERRQRVSVIKKYPTGEVAPLPPTPGTFVIYSRGCGKQYRLSVFGMKQYFMQTEEAGPQRLLRDYELFECFKWYFFDGTEWRCTNRTGFIFRI